MGLDDSDFHYFQLLDFIFDKYYYDQCRNRLQWGELHDTLTNGYNRIHLGANFSLLCSLLGDLICKGLYAEAYKS